MNIGQRVSDMYHAAGEAVHGIGQGLKNVGVKGYATIALVTALAASQAGCVTASNKGFHVSLFELRGGSLTQYEADKEASNLGVFDGLAEPYGVKKFEEYNQHPSRRAPRSTYEPTLKKSQ